MVVFHGNAYTQDALQSIFVVVIGTENNQKDTTDVPPMSHCVSVPLVNTHWPLGTVQYNKITFGKRTQ